MRRVESDQRCGKVRSPNTNTLPWRQACSLVRAGILGHDSVLSGGFETHDVIKARHSQRWVVRRAVEFADCGIK
jgi:hypothetical protein